MATLAARRAALMTLPAALAIALGVSACQGDAIAQDCERGEPTVALAVQGFVAAARDGDLTLMQAQVAPRMTVSQEDLDDVNAELAGVPLNEITVYTHSETPKMHSALVVDSSGVIVARYFLTGDSTEPSACFALLVGTMDEPRPGASITPSTSTTRPESP